MSNPLDASHQEAVGLLLDIDRRLNVITDTQYVVDNEKLYLELREMQFRIGDLVVNEMEPARRYLHE